MNYRKIFSVLVLGSLLSGCAIFRDAVDHNPEKSSMSDASSANQAYEAEQPTEKEVLPARVLSTPFEWAVQYYEAGQYEQAITSFRRLEKKGAKVTAFELIPFYLGMSFKNLKLEQRAIPYLEKFVAASPDISHSQEARLALLLCYESVGNWKKISSTAAEMEKFTLYTENKTMLNLLWSEALVKQGELLGAKQKLAEASSIIGNLPMSTAGKDSNEINPGDEDLFGRYSWTNSFLQLADCENLRPQEMNKKLKKKSFYVDTWIETKSSCVKKAFESSLGNFQSLSPTWAQTSLTLLKGGADSINNIPAWLAKNNFFANEKEARSTNNQKIRVGLYNLSNLVNEHLKNIKYQSLNKKHFEELLKYTEHLIYQLSLPSS